MRTSQNGINMIKKFEGCELAAYKCAANVWTIGYGHTAGVTAGMRITPEQAESYLKEDLAKFEAKVAKYDSVYHWNQNEFDALVSFAYNIGSIDQLTSGGTRNRSLIASKMLSYNKAAGKESAGLTARRETEQELFLAPEYSEPCLGYTAHSADYGWQDSVTAGEIAGVKGKRLEALRIDTGNRLITAQVHVQDIGWMPEVTGTGIITVGTTGQGKAIEAIKIFGADKGLTYKVHTLGGSWEEPAWNGGQAGVTGKANALDLIQITF